ncbi:amidohydrolase family protein [Caulobacter sp. KR2-114]|uniref:amidohydrolase family protein n=1 Tax=Caulobacter sp. KR2-114 TaxID=3400912 RepID=UPI003BFC421C
MSREAILEPDLPIVDPHHHLWDRILPPPAPGAPAPPPHPFTTVVARRPRYLLHELLADLRSGHNVTATVFVQCGAFHKADGPEHLRPVGETEFVNGVAAMTASGVYGPIRACAGIVGNADCTIGDRIKETLEAHLVAGGGRFRGIRHSASADPDPGVLGPLNRTPPGLYASDAFRSGYKHLADYGLSFDAWLLEPQLPDLIDLVRRHPNIPVVLDHVGTPLGIASYEGRREERFPTWLKNIKELSKSANVSVKLGGLAMAFCNFPSFLADPPAPSTQLAAEWKPYLDACIEAFGPERCMFESNFPVDLGSCDYDVLWNAFKVYARDFSVAEKTALFSGTATRVYRLDLPA